MCTGEQRFDWQGVTAFGLVDLVAEDRTDEARAFLDWARSTGFTIVRVLTMLPNGGWLDLSPADGRRALPVLCALARERGLYVQAVALANTDEKSGRYRTPEFLGEQVHEIGGLCSKAGNCVLEIANEPYHGSQAALDDPALMTKLQQEVPRDLPVAWGAASEDLSTAMAGGTFVVAHLSRSGDRSERIARVADLAALEASTGKFVVDNEPIGAAERPERGRRDAEPAAFFAQGVASRLVDAAATFHCEDCLRARVPGPVQQECARAFIEGRRVVPADVRLVLQGTAGTPLVARLREGIRGALLAGVSGMRAWVLVAGEDVGTAVEWQDGWRAGTRVAKRGDVEVWTATR